MKKLVVKDKSLCQACLSCELACSEAFYKKDGFSCISLGVNKKGALDVKACNQYGVCAKKFPEGAISKNAKGVYTIDKKKSPKKLFSLKLLMKLSHIVQVKQKIYI